MADVSFTIMLSEPELVTVCELFEQFIKGINNKESW